MAHTTGEVSRRRPEVYTILI